MIAIPNVTLAIPGYNSVYTTEEKLPFQITLIGVAGAYKEGIPYNNYKMDVSLLPITGTQGPYDVFTSDSSGVINNSFPLSGLAPGKYNLSTMPSGAGTNNYMFYEGIRVGFRTWQEAEKYPNYKKSLEVIIQNPTPTKH